jgi:uncharacterized protein YycO
MLTVNDLRPADILLSTGDATVSAAIRAGTGSRFSHASIYVGDSEIIEAIDPGVVRQSLARAMSDDTLVCVYRRIRMSDAQARQVIRYATTQVGKSYDVAGAVGAGASSGRGLVIRVFAGAMMPVVGTALAAADAINQFNPDRSFFCSELVAMAFAEAGVPIGGGGASTTPGEIESAHVLNLVGNLKG